MNLISFVKDRPAHDVHYAIDNKNSKRVKMEAICKF